MMLLKLLGYEARNVIIALAQNLPVGKREKTLN
jgi:hypothetical protein